MNNDLHMRDYSGNDLENPEQYAINSLGQQALRSTNALVKKSERAIKSAVSSPQTQDIPYLVRPKQNVSKKEGAVKMDVAMEAVEPPPPPPCEVPAEPVQQQHPTPKASMKKSVQMQRSEKPTARPDVDNSLRQSAEIGLCTWQSDTATYGLQNQGPGLALAEESGAGLKTAQAVSQATESSTSAAASTAGPVMVAYQVTEKAVTKVKETIENIAVRAQSSKQTLGALAALFLMPILILLGIAGALRGGGFASNINLSADVLALMPQINAACQAHGIPEYAPLVAAVMMQESGGNVALTNGDVMQCAESLGYPAGTPVPLEESINQGVSVLAHKLSRAGSTGPTDIPAISLALQAYNYGDGYFNWAASHGGGYSKENALSFQQYQMSHGYPSGYGDANYVDHVLRYYQVGGGGMGGASVIANGAFAYPCAGYGWNTYTPHEGIDIPMSVGEPVYACAAGTVTYAEASWHSGMGYDNLASYGNCVFVDHGGGWQSRYAHMSSITVTNGTFVQQGQLIGYVGSTGNSSGPHLHLALYYNGSPASGGVIYAEQAWPQYKN